MNTIFQLLEIASGRSTVLSSPLTNEQWQAVYVYAKKQSALGIIWQGIERLSKQQLPPPQLIKQWYATVCMIEKRNRHLDAVADKLRQKFLAKGWNSKVLKGQSLCRYYPNPLRRSPGDIDLWLWPADSGKDESLSTRRDSIVRMIRRIYPKGHICYHHMDFMKCAGVDVEIHFTPSWMNNPLHNRRLQQYFAAYMRTEAPSTDEETAFNLMFLLLHLYRHFCQEGVSLKQLIDYAMVMKASTPVSRERAKQLIRHIGLLRFCSAMMLVMHRYFDIDESLFICPPSSKEGNYIIKGITAQLTGKTSVTINDFTDRKDHIGNFASRIRSAVTLATHYPSEALWEIPWRIWHFSWRIHKGYL